MSLYVLSQTGTTENHYLFTGEQFDVGLDQYYLRARYYDQSIGRFTQMDTWMGVNSDPVTLHKYLYANVDPSNMVDPTGQFSIGSFSISMNISGILSTASFASTAFDVFSASTDGDGLTAKEAGFLIIASFGGPAGGKLLKMFSKKKPNCGACPCNSFTSDTLVETENGLRPINEIKIGDKVWAYDEETSEKSLQEVTHLIIGEGLKNLVDITFENGELLTSTDEHPFYVDGRWVNAGDLEISDILMGLNSSSNSLSQIKFYDREQKVYNLTVANDHTYFVGKSRILTHNQNLCNLTGSSSVISNGLDAAETAFANKIVQFRGGTFVGVFKRNAPGIDGFLNGKPISLKAKSSPKPFAILKAATDAESSALKAGFSNVDLYIDAPNLPLSALKDFTKSSHLNSIGSQGVIKNIQVFTRDGVFVIPGSF